MQAANRPYSVCRAKGYHIRMRAARPSTPSRLPSHVQGNDYPEMTTPPRSRSAVTGGPGGCRTLLADARTTTHPTTTDLPQAQECSPTTLRARSENEGLAGRARSFQRQARIATAVVPDSACDGAITSVRRRAWQSPIESPYAFYAAH